MTQVARGLDPDGFLLLDVVVNGIVPESLADADLQVQVGGEPWGVQMGRARESGMSCPSPPRTAGPTFLPDSPAGSGAWPGWAQGRNNPTAGGRSDPASQTARGCPAGWKKS